MNSKDTDMLLNAYEEVDAIRRQIGEILLRLACIQSEIDAIKEHEQE